jgi:hypothetical protein
MIFKEQSLALLSFGLKLHDPKGPGPSGRWVVELSRLYLKYSCPEESIYKSDLK